MGESCVEGTTCLKHPGAVGLFIWEMSVQVNQALYIGLLFYFSVYFCISDLGCPW